MLRCIDKAVSYCNTGLLQAGSHLARSPFGLRQAGGDNFIASNSVLHSVELFEIASRYAPITGSPAAG